MAPRLSGKKLKFLKFFLFLNSQKRLGQKENNTKYTKYPAKSILELADLCSDQLSLGCLFYGRAVSFHGASVT